MLRLTTFGGVGLRRDGADDPGPAGEQQLPRRGLALLVLLAAAPEAGVSRDRLMAYLWPESDEERARGALRQTLFSLRRELGTPELVAGGGGVGLTLNRAALTSDIREFDLARLAGDLERAAQLYSGPFLDGFHLRGAPEFERWVERQRAEYAARAADVLEHLARRAAERGDPTASAGWWRRLSLSDPLNTRLVLELMAAEAADGNAGAAIRLAQAHEALVKEELGAAPDPALAALVARIRDGAPGRREAEPSAPPERTTPAFPHPGPQAPPQRERFRELLERELGDRYVLEQDPEIGREGHVRLVRARDLRHDRPVTLKVLHPALASRIDVERFVREIRLTGKLLHPHILPLLDSGDVAGRPWYAVPRPEGETLRSRLSRERQLPPEEAVRIARELADALGQAHAQGIVHRDVSPENILLTGSPARDGETSGGAHALLTNLGLARALDAAAGGDLTVTGMVVGMPAYMSPEQAEGARSVDARSDLYSLAAVLFEMLTGEPLFSGPTPQAIMAKRAAERSPLEGRLDQVPPRVAPVLIKALAKKADARFGSATQFAQALDAARQTTASPPTGWLKWLGWGG